MSTQRLPAPRAPSEFTQLLELDDGAIRLLLERLPSWTIADDLGGEVFEHSYLLRGHRQLWIRW